MPRGPYLYRLKRTYKLSPHEEEVYNLQLTGIGMRAVAEKLNISYQTARVTLQHAREKMIDARVDTK